MIENKKYYPFINERCFNHRILAIWFMDDGVYGSSKYGIRLDVSVFTERDRNRLANIIYDCYKVSFSKGKPKTQKMFFKRHNIENIINLVLIPYFPSMRYKIPKLDELDKIFS